MSDQWDKRAKTAIAELSQEQLSVLIKEMNRQVHEWPNEDIHALSMADPDPPDETHKHILQGELNAYVQARAALREGERARAALAEEGK